MLYMTGQQKPLSINAELHLQPQVEHYKTFFVQIALYSSKLGRLTLTDPTTMVSYWQARLEAYHWSGTGLLGLQRPYF